MPGGGVPAPDLRQLNRYCQRIADTELKAACMRDNDQYFSKTVQQGKIIVGVMHMPVSYTHLDVYKRQGLGRSLMASPGLPVST